DHQRPTAESISKRPREQSARGTSDQEYCIQVVGPAINLGIFDDSTYIAKNMVLRERKDLRLILIEGPPSRGNCQYDPLIARDARIPGTSIRRLQARQRFVHETRSLRRRVIETANRYHTGRWHK